METKQFIEDLRGLILESEDCGNQVKDVVGFEEGGVLTSNNGFTVYLQDGSAFQVTVIKSR